jgi:hypothetical protein
MPETVDSATSGRTRERSISRHGVKAMAAIGFTVALFGATPSAAQTETPLAWPPAVDARGYSRVMSAFGPTLDPAVSRCTLGDNVTPMRTTAAYGPVSADGWVAYVDILGCGERPALVRRIAAPDLQLPQTTTSGARSASYVRGVDQLIREGAGVQILQRDGTILWYDARLREIAYDPMRTLFVSGGEVLHLTDTPGVFLPYLRDTKRYVPPRGMLGFTYVTAETAGGDATQERPRTAVEVWQTPAGRRYGFCSVGEGRDAVTPADAYGSWATQPRACGPTYTQMEVRTLTYDGADGRRKTGTTLLGQREDGTWDVAQAQFAQINQPNFMSGFYRPDNDLPAAERAKLTGRPHAEIVDAIETVWVTRNLDNERQSAAFAAIVAAREKLARESATYNARWRAEFEAEQRAERLEAARRAAAAERARIAAGEARVAAGDPECYLTSACGLSLRARYTLAVRHGSRADAYKIAREAMGRDRTIVIEDILRDWSSGRPANWFEQYVYDAGVNDPLVRSQVGAVWEHAQRWATLATNNAAARDAQNARSTQPPTLSRGFTGARPLSSLEQDYYVGRGYVVVRRGSPPF